MLKGCNNVSLEPSPGSSLSSQDRYSIPLIIFAAVLWTRSNRSTSPCPSYTWPKNIVFPFAILVSSASFCSIRYNPCHRETAYTTPRYSQRGHGNISQPSAGYWASFTSIYTAWRCSETLCQRGNSRKMKEDLQLQQVQELLPSQHPEHYSLLRQWEPSGRI